jgi:hypothetical protein
VSGTFNARPITPAFEARPIGNAADLQAAALELEMDYFAGPTGFAMAKRESFAYIQGDWGDIVFRDPTSCDRLTCWRPAVFFRRFEVTV